MSIILPMDNLTYIFSFLQDYKILKKVVFLNKSIYFFYLEKITKIKNSFKIAKIIKFKFDNQLVLLRCLHHHDCWFESKRLCEQCKKNKIWYRKCEAMYS